MERGLKRGADASYEDWKCEGIGSQHWTLKLVRELAGLLKLFVPSSLTEDSLHVQLPSENLTSFPYSKTESRFLHRNLPANCISALTF